MTGIWDEIRELIVQQDVHGLSFRLPTLTEAERAEVAAPLPGLLREVLEDDDQDAFWFEDDTGWMTDHTEAFMMTGAATISGAAAAATWLARRDFQRSWSARADPARMVRVVSGRPVAWRADLAVRLAGRIRRPGDRIVPVALALLRDSGAEPPDHEPLVAAWLADGRVAGDPLTPHLLPKIFEAAGAGRALLNESLTPAPTPWLALAAGAMPREQVLDGCVRRFLLGGDALDQRFFVRLHRLVAPTPEESSGRVLDYLRLLPSAPGTVAELALEQLRGAGPLDEHDTAEAIDALTFRPEAKLVVKGLSWLDRELKAHPELGPGYLTALTNVYGHTSQDVRDKAVTLTLKHAALFTDPEPILAAADLLTPALARPLVARFTELPLPEGGFSPGALPEVPPAQPLPVSLLDEGAHELHRWAAVESWLAAFVTLAATDREELVRRLSLRFGNTFRTHFYEQDTWRRPFHWCAAMAREMVRPGDDMRISRVDPEHVVHADMAKEAFPGLSQELQMGLYSSMQSMATMAIRLFPGFRTLFPLEELPEWMRTEIVAAVKADTLGWARGHTLTSRLPSPETCSRPDHLLLSRFDELLTATRNGALPPVLLATPTNTDGHLDPEELVHRLETCAAAGREPLDADLAQALLRLPPGPHPSAAERAGRIGSEAGKVVADLLRGGGVPSPEARATWVSGSVTVGWQAPEPTGVPHLDALVKPPVAWADTAREHSRDWWPRMLPFHRELVAATMVSGLTDPHTPPDLTENDLHRLARADGPAGEAMGLLVAGLLTTRGNTVVPPLLEMAARGMIPADHVGRQLALLVRRTRLEAPPALSALENAARRGAHAEVWAILRHFLPGYLPAPGERATRAHTEVVGLAADVATWANAKGEIPEVAVHAGRRGSSGFLRACKHLHALLTSA
ncbi:hypothetical protein [Herbidospora sp. RD11066]